eukprot:UN08675
MSICMSESMAWDIFRILYEAQHGIGGNIRRIISSDTNTGTSSNNNNNNNKQTSSTTTSTSTSQEQQQQHYQQQSGISSYNVADNVMAYRQMTHHYTLYHYI